MTKAQTSNGSYGQCLYGQGFYQVGGNCQIALPIKSIRLSGNWLSGEIPALSFNVFSNKSFSKLMIYRSTDGQHYEAVNASVQMDFLVDEKTYVYNDSNTRSANMIYYRIKGIEQSGSILFSNVVVLQRKEKSILVYPNPAKQTLLLNVPNTLINKKITLKLFSANGTLVFEKIIEQASLQQKIDIGIKSSGNYNLQVITPVSNETTKIIIQN